MPTNFQGVDIESQLGHDMHRLYASSDSATHISNICSIVLESLRYISERPRAHNTPFLTSYLKIMCCFPSRVIGRRDLEPRTTGVRLGIDSQTGKLLSGAKKCSEIQRSQTPLNNCYFHIRNYDVTTRRSSTQLEILLARNWNMFPGCLRPNSPGTYDH